MDWSVFLRYRTATPWLKKRKNERKGKNKREKEKKKEKKKTKIEWKNILKVYFKMFSGSYP
ncbi:hypothetical protein RhiirA4_462443 [Rhizophagus irregularis]|uniref:Uncharacterized protein n=1 Tax=Rhizophagus irregularis TaxID=588596 RepID=A0A2I1GL64_9GLOM|nr:hypothetical protein RhiirA4_462443 [Rhizophagus irregularis]